MKSVFLIFNLCFLVLLTSSVHSDKCITFSSPAQGSIINAPICTLQVDDNCNLVKKVEFQARYFKFGSDTPVVTSLGIISRPPFKFLWDVSDIPNQLLSGVAFFAEATLKGDSMETARREGVFFTQHEVIRPALSIPYEFTGTKEFVHDSIKIAAPRSAMAITGSIYWNEKDLSVLIDVKDPLFYVNMSRENLASLGVEILIDPNSSRKPFPHKDVHIYNVPLYGNPYRIIYKPVFDDSGSFSLASKSLPCDFKVNVTKEDFKGFKIHVPIPLKEFSDSLPKKFGLNLIVKTMGENNQVVRTPWVKCNLFEGYSPFVWGTAQLQSKPFFKNRLLMWGIFFSVGFIFTFIFFQIFTSFKRTPQVVRFEKSEEEQQQFDRIKDVIERKVTQKNIPPERFAYELKISNKKFSKLVKKFTGMSLNNYLMYCRTEIAMERLRSSHCSEASIAESCGFANVRELEKYFLKFQHTSPFKYRSEQQVS